MRRVAIAMVVGLGVAGVAADLLLSDASRWFASHPFATAIAANALLLVAAYVGIDRAISAASARRWTRAARPALVQVLDAMTDVHEGLDRLLETEPEAECSIGLEEYEAAVARYGPLMAATPELAEIYALVARHVSGTRFVLETHRRRWTPSWDPVSELNAAAQGAASAIARLLVTPVVVPSDVRNRITPIAGSFGDPGGHGPATE